MIRLDGGPQEIGVSLKAHDGKRKGLKPAASQRVTCLQTRVHASDHPSDYEGTGPQITTGSTVAPSWILRASCLLFKTEPMSDARTLDMNLGRAGATVPLRSFSQCGHVDYSSFSAFFYYLSLELDCWGQMTEP